MSRSAKSKQGTLKEIPVDSKIGHKKNPENSIAVRVSLKSIILLFFLNEFFVSLNF